MVGNSTNGTPDSIIRLTVLLEFKLDNCSQRETENSGRETYVDRREHGYTVKGVVRRDCEHCLRTPTPLTSDKYEVKH